jgi:hypothetical protein
MNNPNHAQTYKKNGKHSDRKKAEQKVDERNNKQQIQKIAGDISTALLSLGFTLHRCDSKGTNSVYLCVDYGLCNQIRISDHPGKPKYNFRYNVLLNLQEKIETTGLDCERFFYPPDCVEDLLSDIGCRLSQRMGELGVQGYLAEKERLRLKHIDEPGFWANAEEVE